MREGGAEMLVRRQSSGWRTGLEPLFSAGIRQWFGTRSWWVQSLVWMAIAVTVVAGLLWGTGDEIDTQTAVFVYSVMNGVAASVVACIVLQDAIVGEKRSGTAAWVLSKPASREAFVLAKWVPNTLGLLVTSVLAPGVAVWGVLSLAGEIFAPLRFLGGTTVIGLNVLFFLTLTLMLGTLTDSAGGVIGGALGLLFGQQFVAGLSPVLLHILPFTLVYPLGEDAPSLAAAVITGAEPYSWWPAVVALVAVPLMLAVALRRFARAEL